MIAYQNISTFCICLHRYNLRTFAKLGSEFSAPVINNSLFVCFSFRRDESFLMKMCWMCAYSFVLLQTVGKKVPFMSLCLAPTAMCPGPSLLPLGLSAAYRAAWYSELLTFPLAASCIPGFASLLGDEPFCFFPHWSINWEKKKV